MSGLVYAVIVALWAAVLVPIWLRRHDDASVTRSADKYSRAMRTLSRRPARVGQREIVMPPRPELAMATPGVRVSGAVPPRYEVSVPTPGPAAAARPHPSRSRRPSPAARTAAAQLARRRARTLFVLLGLTVLLGALAALSVVPLWAPIPVALLLVAFVVHLRLQARRSGHVRTARPSSVEHPDTAPAAPASTFVAPTPHSSPIADEEGAAPAASEESNDAESDEEAAWRPQSWPLPTYVTKPKAMRPVQVIDLTTPGAWTSGALLEDEAEPQDEVLAAAEETTMELDAIVDRAAND